MAIWFRKMPYYEFECGYCSKYITELRKVGDYDPPICPKCQTKMAKIISPIGAVLYKGAGWHNGEQAKLKRRSKDQGKKFFKRHPDLQDMALKSVDAKP